MIQSKNWEYTSVKINPAFRLFGIGAKKATEQKINETIKEYEDMGWEFVSCSGDGRAKPVIDFNTYTISGAIPPSKIEITFRRKVNG